MQIQVLIQIGNGNLYFPPQIPSDLVQDIEYPYSRTGKIVEMVKEEGQKNFVRTEQMSQDYFQKDVIYSISPEYFLVKSPIFEDSVIYRIVSINTDLPWTITYDPGYGEKIEIFKNSDKYKIIDEDLNYGIYEKMDK